MTPSPPRPTQTDSRSTLPNYAEIERNKISAYLDSHNSEATVADILRHAEVDTLRVYPLIQRMMLNGEILITETNEWGSPLTIKKKNQD